MGCFINRRNYKSLLDVEHTFEINTTHSSAKFNKQSSPVPENHLFGSEFLSNLITPQRFILRRVATELGSPFRGVIPRFDGSAISNHLLKFLFSMINFISS